MRSWETLVNNGKDLEIFATSYFQAIGYYVEANLKWIEDKEDGTGKVDVFELDIYGRLYNKNNIITVLAECKNGCNFNDLFKFSGITKIINANKNILICQSHEEKNLIKTGSEIGIIVLNPKQLFDEVIIKDLYECFMFLYLSNKISNKILDKEIIKSIVAPTRKFTEIENQAYNYIRKHLAILIGEIWRNTNLLEKSIQIKSLIDSNKNFVKMISSILKLKPGNKKSEYYMRSNPICQAAGYLMLKERIAYITCAVDCAIKIMNGELINLNKDDDQCFYNIVHELCCDIELTNMIPQFLQGFVYIFGGFLSTLGNDIQNIASYLNISTTYLNKIILLLKKLFTISEIQIQWGFMEVLGILSLKYVPYPLKGLGIKNREKLKYSIDDFAFKEEWINSISNYEGSENL